MLQRLLRTTETPFVARYLGEEIRVARGEVLALGVLLECPEVIAQDPSVVGAQSEVSLVAVRGRREGALGRPASRLRLNRRRRAVSVQGGVGSGELGPGLDEGRVESHGLLVVGHSSSEAQRITHHALRHLLTVQERVVGGEIGRGPLGELLLGCSAKRYVERLGNAGRDVGLHLEHVRELGVEGLLPLGGRG